MPRLVSASGCQESTKLAASLNEIALMPGPMPRQQAQKLSDKQIAAITRTYGTLLWGAPARR